MPNHHDAHQKLMATLVDHIDSGRTVPCTQPATNNWWTSDNLDDQATAAWLCGGCPALTACGIYVDAQPERCGVWAGMTPTERNRRAAA